MIPERAHRRADPEAPARPAGPRRAVTLGLLASLGWVVIAASLSLLGGDGAAGTTAGAGGGRGWLMALAGFVLPLALIWLAVWSALGLARLRAEAAELRAALAELQSGPAGPAQAGSPEVGGVRAPWMPGADEAGLCGAALGGSPREAGPLPAGTPAAHRRPGSVPGAGGRAAAIPTPPAAAAGARPGMPGASARGDGAQGGLALGPPPPPELTPAELFLALNFPDGPDDREAIRCLRLALGDPGLARLIRAAQDVITLLAGQGIYMDDLAPPAADPRAWRSLAEGVRGAPIAALAGVGDTAVLAVVRGLLRRDEVFRDAAHHFLRQFDRLLARQAAGDDDGMLVALGGTRSGRAFLLLAEATGMIVPDCEAAQDEAGLAQPVLADRGARS